MSTDNIDNSFLEYGQYIAISKKAKPEVIENLSGNAYNQVWADITTTFTILIGIFFPSVTGKSNWFSIFPLDYTKKFGVA